MLAAKLGIGITKFVWLALMDILLIAIMFVPL
jgi:hypothetical protein